MAIDRVSLSSFRNFAKKTFEFSPKVTIIVGANASGKSNILESLYLLSTGRSFKARVEEEMIGYENDIARVTAQVSSMQQEASSMETQKQVDLATSYQLPATTLEVVLTRGQIEISESRVEKTSRKKFLVNGVARRMIDFAGNFKTVLFGPWDLDLVTESPSLRRRFLDMVLPQVDRQYRRDLLSYEKGLRQRNRLLFRIREEGIPRTQLLFWNQLLIKNGNYLSDKRREFIEFINSNKFSTFKKQSLDSRFPARNANRIAFAGGRGNDTNHQLPTTNYQLHYDPSEISEVRLEKYAQEEIAAATTLVGPHRDDFQFSIINSQLSMNKKNENNENRRNLDSYGSRGEQRMGVLWLKLAELAFIESKTNEKPTLLLDDIFSELDHEHRDLVIEICNNQQTIITTADPHFVEGIKGNERIDL